MQTIDELPLEAESVERGYALNNDPTGLPRMNGLQRSSLYNTSSGTTESYSPSPKHSRSRKSGEQHPTQYSDTYYGGGHSSGAGYPTIDI